MFAVYLLGITVAFSISALIYVNLPTSTLVVSKTFKHYDYVIGEWSDNLFTLSPSALDRWGLLITLIWEFPKFSLLSWGRICRLCACKSAVWRWWFPGFATRSWSWRNQIQPSQHPPDCIPTPTDWAGLELRLRASDQCQSIIQWPGNIKAKNRIPLTLYFILVFHWSSVLLIRELSFLFLFPANFLPSREGTRGQQQFEFHVIRPWFSTWLQWVGSRWSWGMVLWGSLAVLPEIRRQSQCHIFQNRCPHHSAWEWVYSLGWFIHFDAFCSLLQISTGREDFWRWLIWPTHP